MHHRIVYIMNVDWDWVKQRPHFLALQLSKSNHVTILYPFAVRRAHLVKNGREGLRLYPIFRIPFGGRFVLVQKINSFVLRIIANVFLKWSRPDIIWISSPELFELLPKRRTAKLVYDCMDDVLAFPTNAHRKRTLEASERELVRSCAHVFCSSANLRDKLIERAGCHEKYTTVHNAFEPSSFSDCAALPEVKTSPEKYMLGYVGTISSWLDFEALVKVVDEFPSVEIRLFGPIDNLEGGRPEHKRIKFQGALNHKDIRGHIHGVDALIMPFKVTDLVQSVDPVKLYEYIFFDKPIISVRYLEIERFAEFLDFYTGHEELIRILDQYLSDGFKKKKYSDEQRSEFIKSNTWSRRYEQVARILAC